MSGAPDLLKAIVAATRARVAVQRACVTPYTLEKAIAAMAPARGFRRRLAAPGRNVIAECKRRSPSRGVLRPVYDPAAIASSYEAAGAAAISVLTETAFFDGALSHLEAARRAVAVPLLRKDFTVDPYQLLEARAAGADAVLLIVAALDGERLRALRRAARELDLDTLVEVHDERELETALEAGADLIGVNNRNLRTLEVSVDASFRLASRMPANVVAVAESGLKSAADLDRLEAAGYRAFLVGERFMTAPDPGEALRSLLGSGARARLRHGYGGQA
jgi:indole-3-glycerol phosphate synthase